uniref:Uncharacterized protein n=1 Tax=Chenopodium quinoa TaxID=63459 RepID=A0A803N114_CHEQI
MQGFRKVDPDKWEFANELFLKGQKHLLRNIRRRKAASQQHQSTHNLESCVEVGTFGLDVEIDRLRRDKQVLIAELVKLRQQQTHTKTYLQLMEQRLKGTEQKQQQMMNFLARALQNPDFLHQLAQQKERRKELVDEISKKRRRPIKQGPSNSTSTSFGTETAGVLFDVKDEPVDLQDMPQFEDSELDILAMEMSGTPAAIDDTIAIVPQEEDVLHTEHEEMGRDLSTLDDGFWEEFLNKKIEEDSGLLNADEIMEEEDVIVLVERLGELGSRPPP